MHPVATPLCPAGHLPLKGGDQLGACSPSQNYASASSGIAKEATVVPLVISPLEGEMAGRPEGGDTAAKTSISLWEEHP